MRAFDIPASLAERDTSIKCAKSSALNAAPLECLLPPLTHDGASTLSARGMLDIGRAVVRRPAMSMLLSNGRPDARTSADVPANTAETGIVLGRLLRRARELRGLTLQQVANETKIPQRRLEALEGETRAGEPPDFYRRAEIRAYARAVHFDERLALIELDRAAQAATPKAAPDEPTVRATPLPAGRLLILVSLVAGAALFGRAIAQPGSLFRREEQAAAAQRSAVEQVAIIPQPKAEDAAARQRTQPEPSPLSSSPTLPASARHPEPATPASTSDGNAPAPVQAESATRSSPDAVTELVVSTQPEGARVTVNGIGWGVAPVTIRHLPAGVKRIRVSKDGYVAEERLLHVIEAKPTRLVIRLRASGT